MTITAVSLPFSMTASLFLYFQAKNQWIKNVNIQGCIKKHNSMHSPINPLHSWPIDRDDPCLCDKELLSIYDYPDNVVKTWAKRQVMRATG